MEERIYIMNEKPLLCIAIPSKTEKFLDRTILDVLEKATGNVEVWPILDGYDCERIDDPRVHYIVLPTTGIMKKRHGINEMVKQCHGEYVMSLDAHCMMAPGFDEQLIKDHQPNWVQVPQRRRLDAENWCEQDQGGRPPISYEYIMWQPVKNKDGFHGYKWDARTIELKDTKLGDLMTIQGSCWFMTKEWFIKCGFMQTEGYMGWGQEGEEVAFTTWMTGGRVVSNCNTWYAHLHKGQKYGRMYHLNRSEAQASYEYSYDFWINDRPLKNRVHNFEWLIDKFWPVPNWPDNWREQIGYGKNK